MAARWSTVEAKQVGARESTGGRTGVRVKEWPRGGQLQGQAAEARRRPRRVEEWPHGGQPEAERGGRTTTYSCIYGPQNNVEKITMILILYDNWKKS